MSTAGVEGSFVSGGHRNRKTVGLAGKPKELAGRGIVGVDALAGVHDQFVPRRAFYDSRRTVGRTSASAIGFPNVFSCTGVHRQQVRGRLVIAEQDQQVSMNGGRASVAPVDDEGSVLLSQMKKTKKTKKTKGSTSKRVIIYYV